MKYFIKQNTIAILAIFLGLNLAVWSALAYTDSETKLQTFDNFSAAKKVLKKENPSGQTFYCNCNYRSLNDIDRIACGYEPRRDTIRARRIEQEHIVPAKMIGLAAGCWGDPNKERGKSNRQWCRDTNETFKFAEADPVNLVPAIGELNAIRSAHPHGIVEGEPRKFGACDFEVEDGIAEPAVEDRRLIGTVWLYMDAKYGVYWQTIEQKQLMHEWARGKVQ